MQFPFELRHVQSQSVLSPSSQEIMAETEEHASRRDHRPDKPPDDDPDPAEEKVIECVALFYEKGKTKLDYIRKEKFRASVPTNINNLNRLKTIVR